MPINFRESNLTNLSQSERRLLKANRIRALLAEATFPHVLVYNHPVRGEIQVMVKGASLDAKGDLLIDAKARLAGGLPLLLAAPIRIVNVPVKVQTRPTSYQFAPLQALAQSLGHTAGLMPVNHDPDVILSADDPTLTAYPDASSGATTCDGWVRRTGVNEAFSTIRGGAGNGVNTTNQAVALVALIASTTSNQYATMTRSGFTFDTSSIGDTDTISSAVLSIKGSNKANGLGDPDFVLVDWTPAANNNIANGDYANFGTVSRGSVAYASWSTTAYNDITFTGTINKTGITAIGARLSWDEANSTTGLTWASGATSSLNGNYADVAGTTSDPKLVVVYTVSTTRRLFFIS